MVMELHTVCIAQKLKSPAIWTHRPASPPIRSENRSDLHGPGSCSEQRGSKRNGILVVVVDNSLFGVVRMGSRLRLSGGMGDPRTGTLVQKRSLQVLMIHMKRIACENPKHI